MDKILKQNNLLHFQINSTTSKLITNIEKCALQTLPFMPEYKYALAKPRNKGKFVPETLPQIYMLI